MPGSPRCDTAPRGRHAAPGPAGTQHGSMAGQHTRSSGQGYALWPGAVQQGTRHQVRAQVRPQVLYRALCRARQHGERHQGTALYAWRGIRPGRGYLEVAQGSGGPLLGLEAWGASRSMTDRELRLWQLRGKEEAGLERRHTEEEQPCYAGPTQGSGPQAMGAEGAFLSVRAASITTCMGSGEERRWEERRVI